MPPNEEFLLYPLDTGEYPACLACGKVELWDRRDQPVQRSQTISRALLQRRNRAGPLANPGFGTGRSALPGSQANRTDYRERLRLIASSSRRCLSSEPFRAISAAARGTPGCPTRGKFFSILDGDDRIGEA
jgi:hypothetical protein